MPRRLSATIANEKKIYEYRHTEKKSRSFERKELKKIYINKMIVRHET